MIEKNDIYSALMGLSYKQDIDEIVFDQIRSCVAKSHPHLLDDFDSLIEDLMNLSGTIASIDDMTGGYDGQDAGLYDYFLETSVAVRRKILDFCVRLGCPDAVMAMAENPRVLDSVSITPEQVKALIESNPQKDLEQWNEFSDMLHQLTIRQLHIVSVSPRRYVERINDWAKNVQLGLGLLEPFPQADKFDMDWDSHGSTSIFVIVSPKPGFNLKYVASHPTTWHYVATSAHAQFAGVMRRSGFILSRTEGHPPVQHWKSEKFDSFKVTVEFAGNPHLVHSI